MVKMVEFKLCMLLLLSRFSCIRLVATPRTTAYQAPPSIGFSRQEDWSGVPVPSLVLSTRTALFWGSPQPSHNFCFPQIIQIWVHLAFFEACCSCPVAKSCLTLCDPMDCTMPGFPVLHHLPEFAQTHVYWVSDAIQPSCTLSFHSPPAFNNSQRQGLCKWVSSSYQVAKVLELQLQHQSFQWIFRVDFL